jgi:nucleotide-binding universal stress UspA family protein
MVVLAVLGAWLATGALVGYIQGRRGHWRRGWLASAAFGPLAIPLAIQANHAEPTIAPHQLDPGERGPGRLSVLVGVDGSDASHKAARTITELFPDRIARLTLASVLDFDTAASPEHDPGRTVEDWPERVEAKAALASLANELQDLTDLRPGTLLLAGNPSSALEAHAVEDGYDLVVAGTRGQGASKVFFGSCASGLGHQHDGVPVLLVP